MWMCNGASQWGQAFDHWCLAVFLLDIRDCIKEWLLCFYCPSLSPLPFDWTLRCWVFVCCFILLYFGCYVVLCVKKYKSKQLIKKKKKSRLLSSRSRSTPMPRWSDPSRTSLNKLSTMADVALLLMFMALRTYIGIQTRRIQHVRV